MKSLTHQALILEIFLEKNNLTSKNSKNLTKSNFKEV
ncbi:hypothetical protein C8N46_11193 [Kordia periserrulae]|uniref:Uncharacterized protein n=1 Tax=Kordia periserrulae TaxID=701523 RepID=A0A2T6BSJ2_9FLAO|nr:hypothetical protein C8N46_11193 [Kordia periserrulae]